MRDRLEFLDGIRGVAALIVVFHHALIYFTLGLYTGQPQDSKFSWDIALSGKSFLLFFAGNFAVSIFFVLSGFVLSHVFLRTRSGPIALVAKRYVRLTVPITAASLMSWAICVLALSIAFIGPYVDIGPGFDGALANWLPALAFCLKEAFVHATITGFSGGTYNGVLWSMQVEFIGSVCLIVIFCFAKWLTRTQEAALNVATGIAVLFLLLEWQSNMALFAWGIVLYRLASVSMTPRLWKEVIAIPLFVAGIYLGCMPESGARDQIMNKMLWTTGLSFDQLAEKTILSPILSHFGGRLWVPFPFMPVTLYHCFGAVLLMGAVLLSRQLRVMFESRVCLFLGAISFGLYLTHGILKTVICRPVYEFVVWLGLSPTIAMLAAVAVFVPIAIAAATAFTKLVEARSIAWSEKAADVFRRQPVENVTASS